MTMRTRALTVMFIAVLVVAWYQILCFETRPKQPEFIETVEGAYGYAVPVKYPFWHYRKYVLEFHRQKEYWFYDENGFPTDATTNPFWQKVFEQMKPRTIEIDPELLQ